MLGRWSSIALFVLVAACGGGETSTTPVSTADVTSSDGSTPIPTPGTLDGTEVGFPAGSYGAGWSSVGAGVGYLEFSSDGTGSVRALDDAGPYEAPFAYTVEGDEISLVDGSDECGTDAVGSYRWSFDDEVLDIVLASDPCDQRARAMTEQDWYALGDTPVVTSRAGEGPVTLATGIGDITWRVVDGQEFVAPPVPFGDGFAAVVADENGNLNVETSADGLRWDPMPSPPTTPERLATHDDELYVVRSTAPTEVFVTTDRGATWKPLAVDPPGTGPVTALVAGPAGVLMTMPVRQPAMPPAPGADAGRTVRVTVSGIAGRAGHDLAGVLYEGDELNDLDVDGIGGFWSVASDADSTTTEIVRTPATPGEGPFPFVSDQPLTVEPGRYTLVIWVDVGLSPASRWVPINTDGAGLHACQFVFDVGPEARTDVTVSPVLDLDGWNTDCSTGTAIPDTDATAPVASMSDADRFPAGSSALPASSVQRLWVLDADTFELTEFEFPRPTTILPVDSGFFAAHSSFEEDSAGTCWTATDGRAWTETPDPCNDIFIQSSFQDDVYGATDVDEGVVSTDGGRSWTGPIVRPGGPGDRLTVGEVGHVAVETAIFGPPVGVVWASPDDIVWERVLNPWPPPFMDQPVIAGDTILIPGELCDPVRCERLDWVGTVG